MTPTEVTNILRQFNAWRRGDETTAQPHPREIGEAIDAAVEMIERLEAAEADALEQARMNGMGGEREAALMAKLEAAEKERDALRARIEVMEQQKPVAFALYSGWARKAVYLSEIEACEQRDRRQLTANLGGSLEAYRVVPLYALPGAKGEAK